MRDRDDLPYIVIERHSGGLGAFVWGALIGAGAALLLAPRSGTQTQEDIRQGVRRVRTAAEERVEAARSTFTRARDRIEDQVDSVREQVSSVRDRIDTRADQARDLFHSGRLEARDQVDRHVSDVRDTYQTAADRAGSAGEEPPARSGLGDVDFVVTEIIEERTEGRADLA